MEVLFVMLSKEQYMSDYTETLESKMYEILPDDDDYYQKLMEITKSFRRFDEALDSFISTHGYTGNLDDLDLKVSFLKKKFKAAEVPVPRNLEEWYTEFKPIERITAIRLCFALELDLNGAEDFLRRVCLQRSFDCHDPKELIFYYALSHNRKYQEAAEAIRGIQKIEPTALIMDDDVVYTSVIVEQINEYEGLGEVVNYICNNKAMFGYNNVKASENIIKLWEKISGTSGIAAQEEKRFEVEFKEEMDLPGNTSKEEDNKRKTIKTVKKDEKNSSLTNIYLQILGLRGRLISSLGTDRSLKPILRKNPLLHPLAEASFPYRDGLTKILNGKHVSDENIRKTLILLAFYEYWGHLAIKRGEYSVEAKDKDADRCIDQINNFLSEAGYPLLYPGNPYDWLFLYSSIDEQPLCLFREFMQQLYYIKQESDEICLRLKK